MTESATARLVLPLLQPGQSQKEMFHNEAVARLDLAVQASVAAAGLDTPPDSPAPGEAWIVGDAPEGAWAGRPGAIAGWSDAGWRLIDPFEGMRCWVADIGGFATYLAGGWEIGRSFGRLIVDGQQVAGPREPAIADPAGGATIDAEARSTIAEILAALRSHGLIDPA